MFNALNRAFGTGFGAVILVLVPTGLFIPRGLAPLFVLLVVLAIHHCVRRRHLIAELPVHLMFSAVAFCLWAISSAFWSIAPFETFRAGVTLILIVFGGFCILCAVRDISGREQKWVEFGLIATVFFGAALVLIEVNAGLPLSIESKLLFKNKIPVITSNHMISRGMTVLALLTWPAAWILWRRGYKLTCYAILIFVFLALASGDSGTAVFALCVGGLAFGISVIFANRCSSIFIVLISLGALTAPFAVLTLPDARTMSKSVPGLGYGVYPRLFIWQSTAGYIIDRPLFGYGLRSARILSSKADSQFVRIGPTDMNKVMIEPIPLHPHNAFLQLWLELGFFWRVILPSDYFGCCY